MLSNSEHHPEDEVLEKYALGVLPETRTVELEEHLFTCASCRERLSGLERFITGLRGLSRGSDAKPIDETHMTDFGPVRLWVRKSGSDVWTAELCVRGVETREEFPTAFEANDFLARRFREQFPDHHCLKECGPTGAGAARDY